MAAHKKINLHDDTIIQRTKLAHVLSQPFRIHIPGDSKNLKKKTRQTSSINKHKLNYKSFIQENKIILKKNTDHELVSHDDVHRSGRAREAISKSLSLS